MIEELLDPPCDGCGATVDPATYERFRSVARHDEPGALLCAGCLRCGLCGSTAEVVDGLCPGCRDVPGADEWAGGDAA